jgi:hypothetical protein
MSSVQCENNEAGNSAPAKKPKRWRSFSLRGMLIAVTLLCVYLARLQYRVHREYVAVQELARRGYRIQYSDNVGVNYRGVRASKLTGAGGVLDVWRNGLGREWEYFGMVTEAESTGDSRPDDIPLLLDVTNLQSVLIRGSAIGDEELRQLVSAHRLRSVCIFKCAVTDTSLEFLREHRELRNVQIWSFSATSFSERALDKLKWELRNSEVIVHQF